VEDSDDRRDRQQALDESVKDTPEPAAAAEARAADDDAETQARQAADSSRLRGAVDVLDETRARLRQTSAELRERGRELDRTSRLVREVERRTEALRSATPRTKPTDRRE
jgi:DNA repair ATPase RecN